MKARGALLLIVALLTVATGSRGQESVCELFEHLDASADGRQLTLTGDLVISSDLAVFGASDCDNQYRSNSRIWPTALSLTPSPELAPEKLQQFRAAGAEADRLRGAGKIVSATGLFSGRLRMVASMGSPGELVFNSFDNLKVEPLPDSSTLPVIPICDLFQNLSAWKGKRVAVRGEFLTTMEGAWISGRCKGGFFTDGYRWPVSLTFRSPAYYSSETSKLYDPKWPEALASGKELAGRFSVVKTATFVGLLRMRSEYFAYCGENGTYSANGFGHLSGAAAELIVDSVLDFGLAPLPPHDVGEDNETERCVPPNLPALCAVAQSLERASSLGCVDRVRDLLAKDGIDSKNGHESPSLRAAIRSGNESVVKLLIENGAPLNPIHIVLWPPLFDAANLREIGILNLLLKSGAQVDAVDSYGETLLSTFGFFDPRIERILLEAGANPNATNCLGQTPLMGASGYGFEESVRVLIEHHADVNLKDHRGRTALMWAAASRYIDAVPLLLEHGADADARDLEGKTALDLAQISKNRYAVELLSKIKN